MISKNRILKIHPDDNIVVALENLEKGVVLDVDGQSIKIQETVKQKHKFATRDLEAGARAIMYGVTVGVATHPIYAGQCITTANLVHQADAYKRSGSDFEWESPCTDEISSTTWNGYHRSDGRVGTRNYWLIVPMVFCENRNVNVIRESLEKQLGYGTGSDFSINVDSLVETYLAGGGVDEIMEVDVLGDADRKKQKRVFSNVDGVKFLNHEGGCGGTISDIENLCNLLAGYITHPNVGGATILSLGCQMAQVTMLKDAIARIDPRFDRPLYVFDQQDVGSERILIGEAVKASFAGMMQIDQYRRSVAPLSSLCLGLECGGSDGFSGISANPVLGYTTDLLVALGASAILSEFPELHGVEQELIDRCSDNTVAERFIGLMQAYATSAHKKGADFSMNPSPGNIADGLITDAMKSAGAAKKGGTSPVTAVLDYTEQVGKPGLHLLCTPGNDVESTTGLAGSGANLIVFTTGLGTPTGNPIVPTIKMSSNTSLALRMHDLIDIDAGRIISGDADIAEIGMELLRLLVKVANGNMHTRSEVLGQDDFIPWKRGVSL